jgi:hypothetical protein
LIAAGPLLVKPTETGTVAPTEASTVAPFAATSAFWLPSTVSSIMVSLLVGSMSVCSIARARAREGTDGVSSRTPSSPFALLPTSGTCDRNSCQSAGVIQIAKP